MAHDYKSLVWFPDNSAGKQCLIAFTIYNPLHSLCGCDHGLLYDLQKPVLTNGRFQLIWSKYIWSRAFNPLCFSSFCLHQWVWALFSSLSPSANLQLSSPCLHTGPWPGVLKQQCALLSSDSHQLHWAKGGVEWASLSEIYQPHRSNRSTTQFCAREKPLTLILTVAAAYLCVLRVLLN